MEIKYLRSAVWAVLSYAVAGEREREVKRV